jgi:serine/threonine protein kinase
MANEQEEMMGDIVTTKSDVYSFAMILWELLTSSIPFKEFLYGRGASDVFLEICHGNGYKHRLAQDT